MNISILGLGTMGKMVAETILQSGYPAVKMTAANRAVNRFEGFRDVYPDIRYTTDFEAASRDADVIFLSVIPLAAYEVLKKAAPVMRPDTIIVSLVSDLPLQTIAPLFGGKVMRIVPTVGTKVKRGITLLSKNDLVTGEDIALISSLFGGSLKFKIILDSQINLLSGVTSCGPGIIAGLLSQFTDSFYTSHFPNDDMRELVIETVMATCILSKELNMSFKDIISDVATKGGITEAALAVLEDSLPPVFNTMTETMHTRHRFRTEKVMQMFEKTPE